MSYSRISLHRRTDGGFLTTIDAEPEYSWVLNEYGSCSFDLALTEYKAVRRYLDFGTLVYIENDKLGGWGGVIDVDQEWNEDGTITVNAYSGEYLLAFRRSPINQVFRDASAGGLLLQFVREANKAEDLLIREGSIWRGGNPAQDTMDAKDFYSHAKALSKNRGYDWCIEPAIDALGKLFFKVNFYERRGEVKSTVLKDGFNISPRGNPLKVQRTIVNDLLGLGDGVDAERAAWNEIDAGSRSQYGLRQGSDDFSGNTNVATVKANTVAKLRELRYPRRMFRYVAMDKEGTFAALRLGNILPFESERIGFLNDDTVGTNTLVRLTGMRHITKTDLVDLTLEEVVE